MLLVWYLDSSDSTMIALVDCRSFYAECERAFRPDLEGRPIVVLSNNDHWIIALSQEAKALGIKRGQRLSDIRDLIEQHNIFYCSSNYTLYADMSRRVMQTLSEISPCVEPYSIDEAFVSLPPGTQDRELPRRARDIHEAVQAQTFIPTTVGIGPTKVLAKVAQRKAKLHGGTLCITTGSEIDEALAHTTITDVWGVGPAHARRLLNMGVHTAAEFTRLPGWLVKKRFTVVGWRLQEELLGRQRLPLTSSVQPRQRIVSARQFGTPVKSLDLLHEAIASYTTTAWLKLREQKSICGEIAVTLECAYNRYDSGARVAIEPTDYLPDLVHAATSMLNSLYREGVPYWRTTIYLGDISARGEQTKSLFSPHDPRPTALQIQIDTLHKRYGNGLMHVATSCPTDNWRMRRDYLSRCYTTRLSDLPEVVGWTDLPQHRDKPRPIKDT